MHPWTTVIIEDQFMFRDFLVKLVGMDHRFECAGVADNGETGLELCVKLQPKLVLLDLNLPRMTGLAMATQLRAKVTGCRILALTSCKDEASITSVLEIGFSGYVEKDQPIATLEQAMVTVAEGRTYFSPTFETVRRRMSRDPVALGKILSLRELEVLQMVARGGTSAEIARNLHLSVRTVGNHRYNIMKKLGLKNAAEVVAFALRSDQCPS